MKNETTQDENWVPAFGEPQDVYRRLEKYNRGDNCWYVVNPRIFGWSEAEDTALAWSKRTGRVCRLLAFNGQDEQLFTENALYFLGQKYLSVDEIDIERTNDE